MNKGKFLEQFKVNIYAWLFLLPSFIFLLLFTFYPVMQTFYLSFFQAGLGTPDPLFTGINNYREMMDDHVLQKVLTNNLWFALGTVPTSMALAIIMALFANKSIREKSFLRTAFFYPTIIPMIAVANICCLFTRRNTD
ncbi:hypothetical protein N752_07880 [Desulforamulus aquiferis]|nr:sugar ABC transporter permease [Desulforamulus aquiferis]RYD05802.1 hypothetical protein N752_07880 [Desulforamulus aquiferis]